MNNKEVLFFPNSSGDLCFSSPLLFSLNKTKIPCIWCVGVAPSELCNIWILFILKKDRQTFCM